jgi:hypothetical protein
MELVPLGELELTYTSLESFDFGADGQLYGTMEGSLTGDRLNGKLQLTNLAPRRADNANLPTLRGLMTTDDGASVWVASFRHDVSLPHRRRPLRVVEQLIRAAGRRSRLSRDRRRCSRTRLRVPNDSVVGH